ncbi:hypothetical protein D9601_09830 [Sphingomonas sp. MA1305]|nr:hypothetical protein [Sphingomonas sp. MA1305]
MQCLERWAALRHLRHSRAGGDPDARPSRFFPDRQRVWIPACAGMTGDRMAMPIAGPAPICGQHGENG